MLPFLFSVVPNWPLVLALVGIVSRLALAPLQKFTFDQQRRLALAKPELEALSRADMQAYLRESARIKTAHGVRDGWLLLSTALQVPIFIWLFRAIRSNASLNLIGVGWIPSLAHADPFLVLPLIAASLAMLAVKGRFKWIQGAITFAFMLTLPAGLGLYSIAAQTTQLALQWKFQRGA